MEVNGAPMPEPEPAKRLPRWRRILFDLVILVSLGSLIIASVVRQLERGLTIRIGLNIALAVFIMMVFARKTWVNLRSAD